MILNVEIYTTDRFVLLKLNIATLQPKLCNYSKTVQPNQLLIVRLLLAILLLKIVNNDPYNNWFLFCFDTMVKC